jgi:hypothetical protein
MTTAADLAGVLCKTWLGRALASVALLWVLAVHCTAVLQCSSSALRQLAIMQGSAVGV